MPNFKEDPEGYGSAFQMNGHTLPGPFQQRTTTPPPGWRAERTPPSNSAPAAAELDYVNPVEGGPIEQRTTTPPPGWRAERAPSASELDYVNPTENSSPVEQISAQNAKERATANINKNEAIAARGSGPIEKRKK